MRVLVVDDDRDHREYLSDLIGSWGYQVTASPDGEDALARIARQPPTVLLTDLKMPKVDGLELLSRLRAMSQLPPTIVMTAFGGIELALRTVHELGAFWFIEKPVSPESLEVLLARAADQSRLATENEELKRQLSFQGVLGDMVGSSPAMREIFAVIRQVAPSSAAVFITGESGTGKELVARAIHSHSKRVRKPFIALNCAAMPESLMESELFGHEKGSFTGAFEKRTGSIEQADGGTLFLDEIGEMPMGMQTKLLRVLEDFSFRRLGGKQELKADVRIVAATNRDPMLAIKEGKLREDLYYRLNVFQIHLPPLRERLTDVPPIVEAMIHNLNRKHGSRISEASPALLDMLMKRRWEGNVRELRNVIERAMILAGDGALQPGHLSIGMRMETSDKATSPAADVSNGNGASAGGLAIHVGMTIDEAERVLIEATLAESANNKTRASGVLGISTKTLHAKLNQYRLVAAGADGDDRDFDS